MKDVIHTFGDDFTFSIGSTIIKDPYGRLVIEVKLEGHNAHKDESVLLLADANLLERFIGSQHKISGNKTTDILIEVEVALRKIQANLLARKDQKKEEESWQSNVNVDLSL